MTHSRSTYITSIALWHWIYLTHRPSQSNKGDGISQPQAKTLMSSMEETFYVQVSVWKYSGPTYPPLNQLLCQGEGFQSDLDILALLHHVCVCIACVWVWVLVYVWASGYYICGGVDRCWGGHSNHQLHWHQDFTEWGTWCHSLSKRKVHYSMYRKCLWKQTIFPLKPSFLKVQPIKHPLSSSLEMASSLTVCILYFAL